MNKLAARGSTVRSAGIVFAAGLLTVGFAAACGSPSSTNTASSSTSSSTTSSSAPATSGSATSSSASAGNGSGTPNCTTADLKFSLGQSNAGAGHVYVPVIVTNSSNHSCALQGYPGVSYVDGSGKQIGDAADRVPGDTSTVVLAPGQAASTVVDQVNVDNFDASQCRPTAVNGIRVYPPNDTGSVVISEQNARGCANHLSMPQLSVKPMQKGSSAQ